MAAVVLLLGIAPSVAAHGRFLASDPADGAVLSKPPPAISLIFSEPIAAGLSSAQLTTGDGLVIPIDGLTVDPGSPAVLIIALPELAEDAYRLTWRAVSDGDLHPSSGSLVFGLGVAVEPGAPQSSEAGSSAEWLARTTDLIGLMLLIGSLGLLVVVRPAQRATPGTALDRIAAVSTSRLATLGVAGAILALIGGLARLLVGAGDAGGAIDPPTIVKIVRESTFGALWLGREAALIACAIALVVLDRARETPARARLISFTAAWLAAGVAIALHASAGHLASTEPTSLGVLLGAVHMLAAGLWVGGVIGLAITVVPLLAGGPEPNSYAREVLRRFARVALASVAVLIVTGLLAMARVVASIDAAITSSYGVALDAKLVLVIALLLAGGRSAMAVHPEWARSIRGALPRRLKLLAAGHHARSSVRLEAGLGIAALAAVALLGATPPANGPAYLESAIQQPISAQVDDLVITVDISPNVPGRNIFTARVIDTRRPAPVPIGSVVAGLSGLGGAAGTPILTRLVAGADDTYTAPIEIPGAAARLDLTVTVERPGLPDAALSTPWAIGLRPATEPRKPAVVSRAPIAAPLTISAVALALGLGSGWVAAWLLQRRSRTDRHHGVMRAAVAVAVDARIGRSRA